MTLGPRDRREGNIAAADCPDCPSDTAVPELNFDSRGVVAFVSFTCVVCGAVFV